MMIPAERLHFAFGFIHSFNKTFLNRYHDYKNKSVYKMYLLPVAVSIFMLLAASTHGHEQFVGNQRNPQLDFKIPTVFERSKRQNTFREPLPT